MHSLRLSIVIPCLNEADNILNTLNALQPARKRGCEIILSDGGSTDNTLSIAKKNVDKIIHSKAGRAIQMNNGAEKSNGDIICFLHADTITPDNVDKIILSALDRSNKQWGFFKIKLNHKHFIFRIIEWFINTRSSLSKVATGDQGIFITKTTFNKLSGFANIALMEDIELTKRLKKISSPIVIKQVLLTSSRRWEKHGIVNTVFLMWQLRLRYFFGASPLSLAKKYQMHNAKK